MNVEIPPPLPHESTQYRSLQILDELANNDTLTQRDLSKKLGIALGLVNSYLKNLVAKGFITVKAIPPKRYAYYLTPKGFTEKTRLAYDLLQDYTRIYREAKSNFRKLFRDLEQKGVRSVLFAGADEVSEIAFITLQETQLLFTGIVDDEKGGSAFFNVLVTPLDNIVDVRSDAIVITSYLKREAMYRKLIRAGISPRSIYQATPERERD